LRGVGLVGVCAAARASRCDSLSRRGWMGWFGWFVRFGLMVVGCGVGGWEIGWLGGCWGLASCVCIGCCLLLRLPAGEWGVSLGVGVSCVLFGLRWLMR